MLELGRPEQIKEVLLNGMIGKLGESIAGRRSSKERDPETGQNGVWWW